MVCMTLPSREADSNFQFPATVSFVKPRYSSFFCREGADVALSVPLKSGTTSSNPVPSSRESVSGGPRGRCRLGRGLPCARMVEIDRRKCLPDPLTFLTDSTILGRLGCSVEPPDDGPHLKRPPIREGVPEAKEQAVVHADKIARRGYHFYR